MPTPDFVLRLRERVGHEQLWLAGACAVVLRPGPNAVEEALLVRSSETGRWMPVGGIVDPGEHPADTAEREVLEETGVTCLVEGLASVSVGPDVTYANGDRVHYLTHTFRCRWIAGDGYPADEETTAVDWFALDVLPELAGHLVERILDAASYAGTTRLVRSSHSAQG